MRSVIARIGGALTILSVLVGSARADTVVPSDRVTSHVNVRADVTAGSPEIGRPVAGEEAEYLGEVPHRYHVRLPNGVQGYVAKA